METDQQAMDRVGNDDEVTDSKRLRKFYITTFDTDAIVRL
jgi:hypothetical protein